MTTQLLASARSAYVLSYEVVATHPHDHSSFTQGLTFDRNSTLYESVGLYGESDVRTVDLASGAALRRTANAPEVFGEGLALAGDALIQLSWRENKAMLSSPGFEVVVREGVRLLRRRRTGARQPTGGAAAFHGTQVVGAFDGRNPEGLDPGVVFGLLAIGANSSAL